MAREFVLPTREFAHLLVSGESPLEGSVSAVCRLLSEAAESRAALG
jgi:hypothetical protein